VSVAQSAQVSLLCLPCAGASASMYLRWQRSLPRWIDLVPIELPGRGTRIAEPAVENYDELVTQLCREHQARARGRYAFFGHSMGALLAYGMTMQWRREGRSLPEVLFVSASPAPSRRDPERYANKEDDAALIADLRKQGGTPDLVLESAEMLRIVLDTLRSDYRVVSSFRRRDEMRLPLPIHVFAGRADEIEGERILAWETETAGGFSVRWFDGGHFFVRRHQTAVLSALVHGLLNGFAEVTDAVAGHV
jgi:surfactin synthase thioesterase subunit